MADVAVETGLETPVSRFEPVASVVHTLFLLLIFGVVALIGYYSLHRQSAVHRPNHLFFYLTTMAWEWLLVGYIYWGLRRRGKSMRNIAGKSWTSASDFFIDIAIAFGFWIVAIIVLSLVARAVGANGMSQAARSLAPQGPRGESDDCDRSVWPDVRNPGRGEAESEAGNSHACVARRDHRFGYSLLAEIN